MQFDHFPLGPSRIVPSRGNATVTLDDDNKTLHGIIRDTGIFAKEQSETIDHLVNLVRREQALRARLWADLSSMRTDPWLWGCSVRVQRLATMRRIRESFHREQAEIDARRDLIELHYNNKETPV